MPFCGLKLTAAKPRSSAYPKELRTLGQHLKKKRLDLGLLQREVAERLGVGKVCYELWEWNQTQPRARGLRAVLAFLGYDPRPKPVSIAERLKAARRADGLTQAELAARLGIDPTTIHHWEQGHHAPTGPSRTILERYLSESAASCLPRNPPGS